MNLEERVTRVKEQRIRIEALKAEKGASYERWLSGNKLLLDRIAEVAIQLEAAEGLLRADAIEEFLRTGNTKPVQGVEIRHFTRLTYEETKAFAWAIEHGIALTLDKKTFEKIAKASPPEFVTVTQEPKVLIATDLSKIEEEK